jgi:hypothetical protein
MPRKLKSVDRLQLATTQVLTEDSTGQDAYAVPAFLADIHRNQRRELVERIIERAQWLPLHQRAKVEGIYLRRLSANNLARELDLDPRMLRRDVRATVHRILAPFFVFVTTHRDGWTGNRRRVAQLCHIDGMSLRAAARVIGISFYQIRRHDEAIRLMFEAFETARRRAS